MVFAEELQRATARVGKSVDKTTIRQICSIGKKVKKKAIMRPVCSSVRSHARNTANTRRKVLRSFETKMSDFGLYAKCCGWGKY